MSLQSSFLSRVGCKQQKRRIVVSRNMLTRFGSREKSIMHTELRNHLDILPLLSRHAASLQAKSPRRRAVRPASDSRPRTAGRGDCEMKESAKLAIWLYQQHWERHKDKGWVCVEC